MTIFRAFLAVFLVLTHFGALLFLLITGGLRALAAGLVISGVWTIHNRFLGT